MVYLKYGVVHTMKGRNSTTVTIRLDDLAYKELQGLAGKKSVNAFIKDKVVGYLEKVRSVHQGVHTIPIYNPKVHKAGDRVLVRKGKSLIEMTVPILDADGNKIYE